MNNYIQEFVIEFGGELGLPNRSGISLKLQSDKPSDYELANRCPIKVLVCLKH